MKNPFIKQNRSLKLSDRKNFKLIPIIFILLLYGDQIMYSAETRFSFLFINCNFSVRRLVTAGEFIWPVSAAKYQRIMKIKVIQMNFKLIAHIER